MSSTIPAMKFLVSLLMIALLSLPAFSKDKKDKSAATNQAELDQCALRGRQIFEYDQAAWHATDVLLAQKPDRSRINIYVARKMDDGWLVSWGKVNESKDAFVIAYQVLMRESTPGKAEVHTLQEPVENREVELFEARALADARVRFGDRGRPYNASIIPAPEGLYLYFIPGKTKDNVVPLGGDVRYLYSADGTQLLETRQMHKSVLEIELTPDMVASVHTHVLRDGMEDSDFYYALSMGRSQMIATEKGLLTLDPKTGVKVAKR